MTANDLAAGVYTIYNRALGFKAETLAITFHDAHTPPTVEILGSVSDNSQKVCSPPSLLSLCLVSHCYYRYLQWRVEDAVVPGYQYIVPLKDDALQACWGADQSVGVAPAAGYVWVINKADSGYYTYVTSPSLRHFPSSFPLVVSWMAAALLSGALPRARQARR